MGTLASQAEIGLPGGASVVVPGYHRQKRMGDIWPGNGSYCRMQSVLKHVKNENGVPMRFPRNDRWNESGSAAVQFSSKVRSARVLRPRGHDSADPKARGNR